MGARERNRFMEIVSEAFPVLRQFSLEFPLFSCNIIILLLLCCPTSRINQYHFRNIFHPHITIIIRSIQLTTLLKIETCVQPSSIMIEPPILFWLLYGILLHHYWFSFCAQHMSSWPSVPFTEKMKNRARLVICGHPLGRGTT